jgi:peptidyl-prolyl cis-trans isomerase SurA
MVHVDVVPNYFLSFTAPMPRQRICQSLLLFCFLAVPLTGPVQARIIEQLIVVIDQEPYTLSNVVLYAKTKMGKEFPSGDLNNINGSDREVLEYFITEKLVEAAVREAGIKITEAEIDQYIDKVKQTNGLNDKELSLVLAREGQTLAGFRATVKTKLEENEIIGRQVQRRVNITNDDVERYYKLNANNFREGDRARLRHILLPLPEDASPDQVQAAIAKSNELYKRIAKGEDFGKLAAEYSDGAGREAGGDIGWMNRGTLLKPIEEVAFEKLAVGQVSQPVRSSMGIHIVKLEAKQNGTVPPLSAVAARIKDELYAKALEERRLKWLNTDLRRKHRVDVKLPGVVFKPEDSKEGTVDSLVAKSSRLNKKQERTLLSYLNPFSYVSDETPFEDDDPQNRGKSLISVFGVPLFTTENVDGASEILSPVTEKPAADSSSSGQSGGFFSRLNPFKR